MCMSTITVVNNHSKMLVCTDGMSEKVHKKASIDRHLSLFGCYIQWKHLFLLVFFFSFHNETKTWSQIPATLSYCCCGTESLYLLLPLWLQVSWCVEIKCKQVRLDGTLVWTQYFTTLKVGSEEARQPGRVLSVLFRQLPPSLIALAPLA